MVNVVGSSSPAKSTATSGEVMGDVSGGGGGGGGCCCMWSTWWDQVVQRNQQRHQVRGWEMYLVVLVVAAVNSFSPKFA